ncbi:pectate lyase-like adhesive domain-containing protein [Bifidobacterium tsurumiense]|uniref:pectate lyase-like adhesive domain-containing protein n=1 Tax=Bifidobacterium tsurumiense TaxID=356829 RepID=UPI000A9CEF89|nr:pectate lyase-like adhesive domain-containing protein [Bifidobacterium tsurumiense]
MHVNNQELAARERQVSQEWQTKGGQAQCPSGFRFHCNNRTAAEHRRRCIRRRDEHRKRCLFGSCSCNRACGNGHPVTVSTADELYNAITVSTANIINIAGNIDLHDKGSSNIRVTLGNAYRRDITIQSADGTAYSVDFSGYSFTLGSGYTVAFKNLDLYGQQWYGAIQGATTYNYENVTYTGSQLVNFDDGAVNFYGNVASNSVATYSNPVSGKSYSTQGNGNQQVIEGKSATFKAGSNVTLTSVSGNVLQIASGGTGVTVEEGANVTLKPRKTTISTEASKNGTNYGIVLDSSSLSVAEGATLTVDLANESGNRSMSGGIYMTGNNAAIDVAEKRQVAGEYQWHAKRQRSANGWRYRKYQ